MFQPKNKLARGGNREGSGRPPNWFREEARKILHKFKLLEFAADVASGKRIEQVVTEDGVEIQVAASVKDRLAALALLLKAGKVTDSQDRDQTPGDSVRNAEAALNVLKMLEGVGRALHAETSSGSNKAGLANGSSGLQAESSSARRI